MHLFAGREGRDGRPGQRLGRAFETLGPVAIKLGQVMATRADIFGIEFARDLGRLKDKLPPFPTEQARREIERSLGRPVESLFTDFGDPIGAASLAQAHPAWLADGRKVAVKVLRPGVERRVVQGLDAMRLARRSGASAGARWRGGWSPRPSSRRSPGRCIWSWTCGWRPPPPPSCTTSWKRPAPTAAICRRPRWSGTGSASGC